MIEPAAPRENDYRESCAGNEFFGRELFYTPREAQVLIEWGWPHDNTVRPHSAPGYRPPASEARTLPMFAPQQFPALAFGAGVDSEIAAGPLSGARPEENGDAQRPRARLPSPETPATPPAGSFRPLRPPTNLPPTLRRIRGRSSGSRPHIG